MRSALMIAMALSITPQFRARFDLLLKRIDSYR
jgi:hypothetical protein